MYHVLKLCSAVAVLIAAGVALAPMPATVHMLVQSAAHSAQPPHAPPGVPTLLPSNDTGHPYVLFNPLFDDKALADDVVLHCQRHGSFRQYVSEKSEDHRFSVIPKPAGEACPLGLVAAPDDPNACILANRFDVGTDYVLRGGPNARREPVGTLLARVNYFREVFAYGADEGDASAPAVSSLLHHPAFKRAAQTVYAGQCDIVKPYMVFANLMLPGQELGVHTDVPQFLGADRRHIPQWLLTVMQHSGLFADRRLRIATGVSWYRDNSGGGAFVFYPRGPWGEPIRHAIGFNTAVVVDTDTVMHGVDTVRRQDGKDASIPPFRVGQRLERRPVCENGETQAECLARTPDSDAPEWALVEPETGAELGRFAWHDMRFSVSWKAYCFADDEEVAAWRDAQHRRIDVDDIVRTLLVDLIQRGRLAQPGGAANTTALASLPVAELSHNMSTLKLSQMLVAEYIYFPRAPFTHVWPGPVLHGLRILNYCAAAALLPAALQSIITPVVCAA